MPREMHHRNGRLALLAAGVATLALAATAGSASARPALEPGAVFTETNVVPNSVVAYNRSSDGTLTPAGQFATGGNGKPAANPPTGFPTLDSSGSVELSADGHNRSCLFAVNAGSDTVSSFRVRPDGLELADQQPTNGSRPISLTSTTRGPDKQLLYVLNSDVGSASIQGYYVSGSCRLTQIGSSQPTSSPDSVPAQIRFDRRGRFLAVSERFANGGNGDIDVFPVDSRGVAGPPVVNPSAQRTPYGLDFNNQDILSVSNENFPPPLVVASTVTTYALSRDGTLTPLDSKPSPGAACWNVFTNNGKFLYVTKPTGQVPGLGTGTNLDAFRVDRDGTLTLIDSQMTTYNALDDALSHNSRFLYVLSDALIPPGPSSAIDEFAINRRTGALSPIGTVIVPGASDSTAGLAAW